MQELQALSLRAPQLPKDKYAPKKPRRIREPITARLRDDEGPQRNVEGRRFARNHSGEVRPQKRDERAQRRRWMPVRRVQIGPSRVRQAGHGECSQMPLFHLRISALAVLLRLPRRSTWNDPEALASRPPLPRCVTFKPLPPPALLRQRRRPKSTLRVAEVRFLMLLHALVKLGDDLCAAGRQNRPLTWEERLSVERKWANAFRENRNSFVPSATKRISGLP